ncbi:MAG: 4-hydroxy-tetrahydrodipicolinate synthase [Acidobacteriota bacterium]|nr:4-hydroxy-tetrahydrodipicolinate synthase [Acidobacteriota bacterium]
MADIKGIIVPIITPMGEDESVDLDELRVQIDRQIDAGIDGIFPCGTNGEAYILSDDERRQILEVTIDQVAGRVPVYAGTGCISTAQTIAHTRMAAELGADVASIITPSFAKASQEELYRHYRAVAASVDLPILLYNIPARTGNALEPATVARLARDVPNIVGAKDSSGDWDNLRAYIAVREVRDDFVALSGNDSLILDTLMEGGAGAIAGCANVYPQTMSSIYDLFVEGRLEEAREVQDSIASLRAVFRHGNPNTVIKVAVAELGHPVGACRAPFNWLPDEGVEELRAVLEENKRKGMR